MEIWSLSTDQGLAGCGAVLQQCNHLLPHSLCPRQSCAQGSPLKGSALCPKAEGT